MASRLIVGWREWVQLPDLGVPSIKAKVDTGARTSALHAEEIEISGRGNKRRVSFNIYPEQRNNKVVIRATAPLLEERSIRSSNGRAELRPVIATQLGLGEQVWMAELTLTSRSLMGFRMLLGRTAVRGHALVDPGRSYLLGKR
jgi:hypothetical protein